MTGRSCGIDDGEEKEREKEKVRMPGVTEREMKLGL